MHQYVPLPAFKAMSLTLSLSEQFSDVEDLSFATSDHHSRGGCGCNEDVYLLEVDRIRGEQLDGGEQQDLRALNILAMA